MEVEDKSEIINIRSEIDNSQQQCRICLKSYSSTWDLFQDGKNVIRKLIAFANVQVSLSFFIILIIFQIICKKLEKKTLSLFNL